MPEIILVSGSTRDRSTNTAALRACAELAPSSITTHVYGGLADLPAFVPDAEDEHPSVAELHRALETADLVLFCTPEYAGTLPGSFKNLLDWTVGTGDLYEKPVAWINVAAPNRGGGADATLELVLGYVTADVVSRPRIQVRREALDGDGMLVDEGVREELARFMAGLAERLTAKPGPTEVAGAV